MSNQINPITSITQKEIDAMLRNAGTDKRPPIRNFKTAALPSMELPPVYVSAFPAGASPAGPMPVINYGIDIRPKPEKRRGLTAGESQEMFGISGAVKMNFVPQMLIAVALDEVAKFISHCREHRISEFKKHNRLMKLCVEEYTTGLQKSYGSAFSAYASYVERYFQFVEVDRFKMRCSISNIVNRQLPKESDREAATLIAIIHNLINYSEMWDAKMDKLIASKLDTPVNRRQNEYLRVITAMCLEFEETWRLQIKPDTMIDMNMAVMTNRASALADAIIGEEMKTQVNQKSNQ